MYMDSGVTGATSIMYEGKTDKVMRGVKVDLEEKFRTI
jgi:hypothetical protein